MADRKETHMGKQARLKRVHRVEALSATEDSILCTTDDMDGCENPWDGDDSVILVGYDDETGVIELFDPKWDKTSTTTADRVYGLDEWFDALDMSGNAPGSITRLNAIYPDRLMTYKVIKGGETALSVNLDRLPLGSEIWRVEGGGWELGLELSAFRKEKDSFVQRLYLKTAGRGVDKTVMIDEDDIIEDPVRYSFQEVADMMNAMYDDPADLARPDERWQITKVPTFIDLGETVEVGYLADEGLEDPGAEDFEEVRDCKVLIDRSESVIDDILDDARAKGIIVRFSVSAAYRKSHEE